MNRKLSDLSKLDTDEILAGLRTWVEMETPSFDGAALNRLMDHVEAEARELGATITRSAGTNGFGDVVAARMPWGGDGPGILVLSHLDTVHDVGTLKTLPFRQDGDRIFGPGIYDMKGGAYLSLHACRLFQRQGIETPLPITLMFVPDEEINNLFSRPVIEAEAKKSKYVLVAEPARDGGRIVTARVGVGTFNVHVKGRPAHAGVNHRNGRNAIKEMARQILAIEEMTDYERDITVCVGTISGGTRSNVVPAECRVEVDLRIPDDAAGAEMCERFSALRPVDPDVELTVTGGLLRPAYEMDEGIAKMFAHAHALAADIGFELEGMKTGGGSDGNFTAALGIPTLDGLGVDGDGAHTDHEHLNVSSIVPRGSLMVRLLETLE
jgi:glutamate carboxypeptidase